MKTTDFNKPVTSALLETNLVKQFGSRVNLEKYDREQLEDIRNKLRTRIFQHEGKSKMNDLLTNETYQKDKAMLELLNLRIKEMLGEQMQKLRDKIDQLTEGKKGVKIAKHPKPAKGAKPDFLDMDKDGDKKEPMKKAIADKKVKEGFPTVDDAKKNSQGTAGMKAGDKKKSSTGGTIEKTKTGLKHTAGKNYSGKSAEVKEGKPHAKDCDCKECMMQEGAKPDFIDADKDGNKKEPMKKAFADKKKNPFGNKKKVKESVFKHNVRFVNESVNFLLQEDEEAKAKTITAAGDIVNDYTSWMQRVGQYQTKAIIELADSIRADFGQAEAETFKQAVGPALSATLETLTQQREAISGAVAALAGGAAPADPMGADPMDIGMEPGLDAAGPDEMNPELGGDEFGASDAAVGGDVAAGRPMRESKEQRVKRKLAEAHNLMAKLSK
jgi:hypothetical protein